MKDCRLQRFQKKITEIIILGISCLFLVSSTSYAEVPHLLNYQGRLTDASGKPLADGTQAITFRIYDAETAGNLLWEETQSIATQKGIFNVLLGSVTSLNLTFDKPYFLEIKVGIEVMSPRQRITSAGYAIRAEKAEDVVSVPKGAIILWRGPSCPTGYLRISELDGKFLVAGSSYNPSAGGNNTHIHNHTLNTNLAGVHTHPVPSAETSPSCCQSEYTSWSNTFGTKEAGDHTHTVSGSIASSDNRPEYATILACEKQ